MNHMLGLAPLRLCSTRVNRLGLRGVGATEHAVLPLDGVFPMRFH